MTKREHATRSYATPSPGHILKQKSARSQQGQGSPQRHVSPPAVAVVSVDVPCNPFRPIGFADALIERGVMLAPLLVVWNYRIAAARSFAKWLKTQDIILSDARLSLNEDTVGAHYFGTYIAQQPPVNRGDGAGLSSSTPVAAQTLWGFSSEAAMLHMFDLCRGRIDRVSIVENDLRDFVLGLKAHINQAGQAHFSQTVLLAPVVL